MNATFRRFSLVVLGYTVLVILWGAYVRASGAGAGCGSHWPLCNGQVVPRPERLETVIELAHRLTSGLLFLVVVAQWLWARRVFKPRTGGRWAAHAGLFFIVTEALLGAGLVLFKMVAGNTSELRAGWAAGHLVNTFALVAALSLVVFFAGRSPRPPTGLRRGKVWPFGVAFLGLLLVATSGAVAALGGTLFPTESLMEGFAQDLSPTAHLFVKLRVLHPLLAVITGAYLLGLALTLLSRSTNADVRRRAVVLGALVLGQLGFGLLNLVMLAPIPMQLGHLLIADALWIWLVWLAATVHTQDVRVSASAPGDRLSAAS